MTAPPDAEPPAETSLAHLPLMLTVPEAARVLRVSRSAAYKLAQEWDATRGHAACLSFASVPRILVRRADLAAIVGVDDAA